MTGAPLLRCDDDTGTSFNISHFHHKKRLQKECSKLHGSWTPKTSRVTLRLLLISKIQKKETFFLKAAVKKASSEKSIVAKRPFGTPHAIDYLEIVCTCPFYGL